MNLFDQLRFANNLTDFNGAKRKSHLEAIVRYVSENKVVRRQQIKDKFNHKSERQISNDINALLDAKQLVRVDRCKVRAK